MTKDELLTLYKKFKTQKALRTYLNITEGKLTKLLAEYKICKNITKQQKAKENFINKAKKIHGDKFDYSKTNYERSCLKVKIKCKRCNKYFFQTANNHLNGQGCPYCKNELNSLKQRKSRDKFISEANAIFGTLYDYSYIQYIGAKKKIKIYCNKCHRFFYKAPDKHLCGKQGCPYCNKYMSRGENEVAQWLEGKNIQFTRQKYFKDCRDLRPLPFDFYLPEYNICIEYQGRQHYILDKHSKFQKTLNDLLQVKMHDNIKKEYCKKNNIILIEIIFNKDTKKQLEKLLLPLLYNNY